ncbi:MAG TPA: sigma-70 family RNA polymerase sigma factor [Acidobacteriota bacterium]|nr:sigma-70 family RNA polymerase sigma factor [Acidobacteriota bacterium]
MDAAETEREVVQRVLSGETEKFRDIVAGYKGLVFHVVRSLVPNESDHEDLAQDIFIKVYRNLQGFRFRSGLATWISRIAYHTCLNYLRRWKAGEHLRRGIDARAQTEDERAAEPVAADSGGSLSPHVVLCVKEIKETVHTLIQELPPTQRLILTLHHLDGFGIPELSEMTGMPAGTIKSHLFRARARLRDKLLAKFRPEDLIG